jgi:signal transduction histidine kinase
VFPILFVYTTESFFNTANLNIESSERQRVSTMQDSLAQLVRIAEVSELQTAVEYLAKQNSDVTEIRILSNVSDGMQTLVSLDPDHINAIEPQAKLFSTTYSKPGETFISPIRINEVRYWQAARQVQLENGEVRFIFTEHSFGSIDEVMMKRRQESYLGLSAIFLFLMGLAYWFAKQIDWRKKYLLLEAQLHERDLFTNMIAHEFRAPLTVISGYVSFLMESQAIHPAERRFVTNIQASTLRLLALVNDFLEVARIQSGKMAFEFAEVDVRAVIQSVVESNTLSATKKGLTLTYVPNDTAMMHKTDSKRLTQVLQNMVSNAIKYTEKGSVEIVAEQNPLATVIRIKDTGMGISAEDQQKLFAPFARVGGVEKTAITGTGLGMWITKQMIDLLKGTVSIESIKGVGTHVVITLKR